LGVGFVTVRLIDVPAAASFCGLEAALGFAIAGAQAVNTNTSARNTVRTFRVFMVYSSIFTTKNIYPLLRLTYRESDVALHMRRQFTYAPIRGNHYVFSSKWIIIFSRLSYLSPPKSWAVVIEIGVGSSLLCDPTPATGYKP
jgi:hypothetical protein